MSGTLPQNNDFTRTLVTHRTFSRTNHLGCKSIPVIKKLQMLNVCCYNAEQIESMQEKKALKSSNMWRDLSNYKPTTNLEEIKKNQMYIKWRKIRKHNPKPVGHCKKRCWRRFTTWAPQEQEKNSNKLT